MTTAACILGCSGPALTADEAALFADAKPWGFILFGRNIVSPTQVRRLVRSMREVLGRGDAPVLVDQEGGRVQRLGPPHWRRFPPGRAYGRLKGRQLDGDVRIAWLGGRLLAQDLSALGVNVNCAPVLDVADAHGHDSIGDRALSEDPVDVARLGRAMADGMLAGGVLPVIKHMPGQGRARSDSHHGTPCVEASLNELVDRDLAPFRALADLPIAMTAHVVFSALDPDRPATCSPTVIDQLVRKSIGFDGLLITDDLSMQALQGSLGARAETSLGAGCDIALYGQGDLAGARDLLSGVATLAGRSAQRADAALSRIAKVGAPFDAESARARFDAAFEGRWAA